MSKKMFGSLELMDNSSIKLWDAASDFGVLIQSAATMAADTLFQLPDTNGTSGQMLQTDGSGVTSWASVTGFANTALSNLASTAVNVSIIPGADYTISLGDTTHHWNTVYANTISSTTSHDLNLTNLAANVNVTAGSNFIISATATKPFTDLTGTLGTSTDRWSSVYTTTLSSGATNLAITAGGGAPEIDITGSMIPVSDSTYSLGSPSLTWSNVYTSTVYSSGVLGLYGATKVQLNSILDANSHNITNLSNPSNPQDAVTKFYVDNAIAGLSWKNPVRVTSTADVTVSSAPAAVDGVTLSSGDRVLLKDQTASEENGIYVYNGTGSALTRSPDMSTWDEVVGSVMLVLEGTQSGSKWVNANIEGGTLDTDPIDFVAFSVAGGVTTDGSASNGQVTYWTSPSSIAGENQLATSRGGTGADSSAFTGVAKVAAGVWSASTIVNADVNVTAGIVYSKLNLSASLLTTDLDSGFNLPATKGGTGVTSYTAGDILYASTTTALSKLSTGGAGNAGQVLTVDGGGLPSWATPATTPTFKTDWVTADTASKTFTLGFTLANSTDAIVQIYDVATGAQIDIDSIVLTTTTVTVSASSAPPATNWRVNVIGI